jgi:hypothetical protein
MLVYRTESMALAVRATLDDLERRIASVERERLGGIDELRSVLIDAGEVESGLIDAVCPDEDDTPHVAAALDELTGAIAETFVGYSCGVCSESTSTRTIQRVLRRHDLPDEVEVSRPEGFAFYGLFPEVYIDAACQLAEAPSPRSVVVIGIRSIGTTLSAVVAATLRARGIATERLTVRPRGHPFDRRLRLSSSLTSRLRELSANPGTVFAIVDEGPGLSGSSFASVVESLSALGVPDERIVLLPSWNPDESALSSERARRIWPRHRKFVSEFDDVWLRSGRLARAFDAEVLRDLSAGSWRDLFFSAVDAPAIQPQHERRKFLVRVAHERMLIKFEGLDRGARTRRARAEEVASAGFAPPVRAFTHGFLATSWIEGMPLTGRVITPQLLCRLAHYLAWIGRCQRTGRTADPAPLVEMLRVNAHEALGREASGAAVRLSGAAADAMARAPAVRVDGRMFPHEWLGTSQGFVKTDVASHFDDHFYPGETDVAWDVAAAAIEFELDSAEMRFLIREYKAASGDTEIDRRLRVMRPAYAAFRLGYTTLGASALGTSRDAERLRDASRRYANVLQRELSASELDGQSCATGT